MSDQQRIREAFRRFLPELISGAIEEAAGSGQERLAGEAIAAELMNGDYDAGPFTKLARGEATFLQRKSALTDWKSELVNVIAKAAEGRLALEALPLTKYHSGPALRRIVTEQLEHDWDAVSRSFDELCEARQSDWFAHRDGVRRATLIRFADLLRLACLRDAAQPAADERPLKARLKALTVLVDEAVPEGRRLATLNALTEPSTSALPYVARYLFPNDTPVLAALPVDNSVDLAGFSEDLLRCCPEADMVRDAAERFDKKEGLFGQFVDVDAAPRPEHSEQFANLPDFVPDASSPLLVPKAAAVPRHRAQRYRIPDGIVAALGLSIVLEWTLRQCTLAAGAGSHERPRAAELAKRLRARGVISQDTTELLTPIFDCPTLSLRDAISHGAFFGDDPVLMHRVVAGMARALRSVVDDVARNVPDAFTRDRWDKGTRLDPKHTALANAQLGLGLVIFDQIGEGERGHLFEVLRTITPDKRLIGQASFLFFAESYQTLASRKEHARPELFATCLGSMVALEDLFRAVLERAGHRVLRVEDQGNDAVKCQLAILDASPGNLLDAGAMTTVLGPQATTVVADAFAAARAFRDQLMHGHLVLLSSEAFALSHLIIKLLFLLSASVQP